MFIILQTNFLAGVGGWACFTVLEINYVDDISTLAFRTDWMDLLLINGLMTMLLLCVNMYVNVVYFLQQLTKSYEYT